MRPLSILWVALAFSAHAETPTATLSLSTSRVQDGSPVFLKVECTSCTGTLVAKFESSLVPLFQDRGTHRGVIAVPYLHAAGPGKILVLMKDDRGEYQELASQVIEVISGQYASEVLKVDPKHVKPQSKKILARVAREQKEIGQAYSSSSTSVRWSELGVGEFKSPIPGAVFTSRFGSKRVYNGVHQNSHMGLDLRAAVGTPIVAPLAGTVVYSKDTFFLGNMVILDHGGGLKSVYGHMSSLQVRPGQAVAQGDLLGKAGMTGRASGPHLHWMAVVHKVKVDPRFLLTESSGP